MTAYELRIALANCKNQAEVTKLVNSNPDMFSEFSGMNRAVKNARHRIRYIESMKREIYAEQLN